MSLKTDYALAAALDTAYNAGVTYIGTQAIPGVAYLPLSTGLANAAGQGKETFTVNVPVSVTPVNLRLLGKYWQAFLTGIYSALAAEGIYNYEVTPVLNTADTINTSIDFNFTF